LTRRLRRNNLPALGRALLDPLHDRLRRGRGEAGGEAISVELRAVNSKFCEVKPRLPRELSSLEPELAKTIKGRISRGVVEAFVRREAGGARGAVPHADLALAAAYAKAFRS